MTASRSSRTGLRAPLAPEANLDLVLECLAKDLRPLTHIKDNLMRFSMREWLKLYREINKYGEKLRRFHYAKDKDIPPGKRLSRDTVALYLREIESLTERTKRYLDGCGLMFPKTPWKYSDEDKTTWPSHDTFAYKHLMPRSRYVSG